MPRKMVSMRFDPDVLAAFDKRAAKQGVDRTTAIEELMRTAVTEPVEPTVAKRAAQEKVLLGVLDTYEALDVVRNPRKPAPSSHRHTPAKLLAGSMAECTCGARRQAGRWYEQEAK